METEIQAVNKECSSEVHPARLFPVCFFIETDYILSEQKRENFKT
jgi:hypothetical protein